MNKPIRPPSALTKLEFDTLDADSTGQVSLQNLADALQAKNWPVTETELKAMVDLADVEGTGNVSLAEYARLRQLMEQVDHTHTRRINRTDIGIELRRLGLDANDAKISDMIQVADEDGDDKVGIFEFWRLLVAFPSERIGSGAAVVRHWYNNTHLVAAKLATLRQHQLDTAGDLVAGTACGAAACLVGHPFDTVKIRMQMDPKAGIMQSARHLGLGGLYRGLGSPMATQPLITAICFMSYGQAKAFMQGRDLSTPLSIPQLCLCGAFSGLVNTVVVAPMELVKCTMQAPGGDKMYGSSFRCAHSIVSQHGVRALFRGSVPTILREVPSYVGYFASYEGLKQLYKERYGEMGPAAVCGIGGIAGVVTWTVSYPQDVIKSHIQLQDPNKPLRYKAILFDGGFWRCGNHLVQQEGWRSLWRGYTPCALRSVPANAAGFFVYEQVVSMWSSTNV